MKGRLQACVPGRKFQIVVGMHGVELHQGAEKPLQRVKLGENATRKSCESLPFAKTPQRRSLGIRSQKNSAALAVIGLDLGGRGKEEAIATVRAALNDNALIRGLCSVVVREAAAEPASVAVDS